MFQMRFHPSYQSSSSSRMFVTWPAVIVLVLISCGLFQVLRAQPSPTPEPTNALSFLSVDYAKGFDCNAGAGPFDDLTLNPGPRAFPRLTRITPGNSSSPCYLEMTTDNTIARGVSAFLQYRFKKGNQYVFTSNFTYRMTGPSAGKGDGFAFVMHQDIRGKEARGGQGGELGVYGSNLITPALIIEFDSVRNQEFDDSFVEAIHVRKSIGTTVTEITEVSANIRTSSMTERKNAVISYIDGRLRVTLDGVLRVDLPVSLQGVLSRREVFAGFTAATGQQGDLHDIFTWTLTQAPAAPTIPTNNPSSKPSNRPSRRPSARPSRRPSKRPSVSPSKAPTRRAPSTPTPPTPTPTCLIPIPTIGPILCIILSLFVR